MTWTVFCDFDGTVSLKDTTDVLLERHAGPEWRDIEALWIAGRIGSAECMRRQVELLRATHAQLDAFADGVEIDAGFAGFARFCEKRSVRLQILSDGLDYVIERVLAREGLGKVPVYANHLRQVSIDSYTLLSPHASRGCAAGTCKCAVLGQSPAVNQLYIGDGRSDFCVAANAADLVIAKDSLLRHCADRGIPHVPFQSFDQAGAVLQSLLETLPPNVSPPATLALPRKKAAL